MGNQSTQNHLSKEQVEEILFEADKLNQAYDLDCIGEDTNVIWQPQAGSQQWFLTCQIYECLLSGPRGTGKTDVLLMDFARDCGVGWGSYWFGMIFRKTYRQLTDVVAKSRRWYPRIFPGIKFNQSELTWIWPTGERLMLSYMDTIQDYESIHGFEIPWEGFEELTNWGDDSCYEASKTCCRSSCPVIINERRIPKRIRATTNPYGKGHSWIKKYFISAADDLMPVRNNAGQERVWINSKITENKKLMEADPQYINTLSSIKDPNKRKAWFEGSWDIVSGGIIGDLWDRNVHVLKPFDIPKSWRVDRAMDWGSTSPFTVGWFAESDGSEVEVAPGKTIFFPKKSLILIHEWYGWTGEENIGLDLFPADVSKGIIKIEREYSLLKDHTVLPGPADNSIFGNKVDGLTIGDRMRTLKDGKTPIRGVTWKRSNKNPGSRIAGLSLFRSMVGEALKPNPEEPCFYVFDTCRDGFLRTVIPMQRDDKNPDDADDSGEDHSWDMTRYRILSRIIAGKSQEI